MRVNIRELQRNLAEYLERVQAGETVVIIVEPDEAVAELRPVTSVEANPRPYGLCESQFRVPEDFDAPLPDSIIESFEEQ